MTWRPFRRTLRNGEVETVTTPEPTRLDEAIQARLISEEGLRHAIRRDPFVRSAAGSLRGLRRENHFAESMNRIFKEKHP